MSVENAMGGGTLRATIPLWRKALSLFLSAVLVFQNLTCWMTPAWAEELAAPDNSAVAALQAEGADQDQAAAAGGQGTALDAGGEGAGASNASDSSNSSASDSSADASSGGNEADGAADGTSGSGVDAAGSNPSGAADAPSVPDSNGAASVAGNGSDASSEGGTTGTNVGAQQEPQASSDSMPDSNATAAASGDGSDTPQDDATPVLTYNARAASTPIDGSTSNGMVLDIKYPDGTQWNGEPVSSDTLLHGEINGNINEGILTVDKPNLSYTFPESISVPSTSGGELHDGSARKATWHIDNGVFYITYEKEWLAKHPSGIKIGINFDFNIKPGLVQDGENVEVSFPGIATPVSIPGKDGNVSGNKWGTVDEATQTVTWNIQLNVATTATDVTLTDTIGSNLTFAGATYKLDGADLASAPSVNGQTATFKLGNLSKGQHTLTYTTPISPDAWKTVTADGGQLSGVDNTASWTWGSKGDQSNKDNPAKSQVWPSVIMVGKSASGTPEDITWTATLNTGSLKADMAGYVFTDTLGSGHAYMGSYEVKDASGATVATGELPADGNSFSYTFGEGAGKQAYTIVYHTKMTDTSSKDPVTNKAEVENPKGGPKGSSEGKFVPNDDTTYISKRLVSADTAATDGFATWESTIYTSRMSATTDVTKVSFTDEFQASQYQHMTFDSVKLTAGDRELVAGADYEVTENGQWNNRLAIQFKGSDAVKALLGTTDIVVSYRTKCDGNNDTYTNTSSIHTPTVDQDAQASYIISVEKVPAVAKDGSIAWDPNFDWGTVEAGSTEKGAWVANWTVYVNRDAVNDWTHKPAGPLGGDDVVVTDNLPQDMSYVPGSSRYYLIGSDNNTLGYSPELHAEPSMSGNTATFTVKADASVGVKDGVNYFVQLTYKTVAHASAAGNTGAATQFTNSATAQSGSKSFPAGSKTVEASSKVVEKTAEQVANSSYIKYTIKVNETGLDLMAGSDTLTLTDTMDPKCTYLPATFHVYYHGTANEVPGCSTLTENVTLEGGARATRLTVTIPDSTAVDVVYQVQPAGNPGDQVDLVNNVELSGVVNGIATHQKQWTVVKAGASTEGTGYGITIVKSDAADATKTLEGAEFELHQVGWDNTDSRIGTQTSDDNGQVQFGSKDAPLLACTLYYFVETKAPAGYQLSSDKTYFMFKGSYSQEAYQEALGKAKKLGVADPSPATSFNITDKKSEAVPATGEFRLELAKTVNGEVPKAGETFEFSATAEGEGADQAPALANVTTGTDGKAAFATAKLSDKDAGKTYTYRIREVTEAGEGWTNAPDVIATVVVGMPTDSGDLATSVTYRQDADNAEAYGDAAQFDNTYQAKPASAAIAVDKTVNGAKDDSIDKQFTFELRAASEGAPMPEGDATLTVDGTGAGSFGPISYEEPGVYRYVVHETTTEGGGWRNDSDVNVTVEVTLDDATRDLVAKVTYDRGTAGDSPAASFDDTHIADGNAVIAVSKTVNGSATAKPDETFEFQLFRAGEDSAATGEQLGRTVSVKTGQTATFDALSYTADDAGKTFAYVVHEVGHTDKGWVAHEDVPVTVSVALDDATHRVVATVDYGQDKNAVEFDDLYATAGSATISVVKTVNGEAPAEDARFQFRLEGVDDASKAKVPEADTAETVGSDAASFGELEFGLEDAGKTFHFAISETTPATAGWTMAEPVDVAVTVGADMGDGTLGPCSVEYSRPADGGSAALFDNDYEQAAGEFQLAVVKTVNGSAPLPGEEFSFSAPAEGEDAVDAPVLADVTTGADGTAAFEPVGLTDKDAGKTYTYRIHEETQAAKGWANAPDVIATVAVSGRGADNRLTASVTYKQDDTDAAPYEGAARFDNKYAAMPAVAALAVDKTVNGVKDASVTREFTFGLSAVTEGAPMPAAGGDVATVRGTSSASFGSIFFSEAGEYEYVIRETSEPGPGWTNANDVTATVTVGYAENGRDLVVEGIEYSRATGADGTGAAAFDNAYGASGAAVIEVSKTVNGGSEAGVGESFTFDLYEADEQGDRVGEPVAHASTEVGGTASFEPILYTLADAGKTFRYVVHETGHDGDGWTAAPDVPVSVAVSDCADGTLACDVTYPDGADTAAFDDTYVAATGEFRLAVSKTVNGEAPKVGEVFEFSATAEGEGAADAPVLVDVTTDESGRATFGPAELSDKDAGKTYTYTIRETGELGEGWTKAGEVTATVKVSAERDAQGRLAAEVTYSRGTASAEFDNAYQAKPASAIIAVDKTVNGAKDEALDKQFTFALLDTDGQQVGDEAVVSGTGIAKFEGLVFDAPGTYAYTVHETTAEGAGWKNDSDVTVTVTVGYAEGGRDLAAAVAYSRGTDAAAFDDTYTAVGSAELSVVKTVNGETPAEDQAFDFRLSAKTEGAPMPERDVATTDGAAAASFGEISFGLDDAGKTYEYTISETTPETVGWTMAAPADVWVTVGEDMGDGTLVPCSVGYSSSSADGSAALFDNAYEQASGEFQLAVSKTVNGSAPLPGEEFAFSATAEGDGADEAPALADVTTDGDGSAVFEVVGLSDKDAGKTYTYHIHETSEFGEGWINAPDVVATVAVSERGADNRLAATVTYSDGTAAARFDNKHEATGSATIAVAKQVNGASPAADQKFDFALSADDEASEEKMPALTSVTTEGDAVASFGSIDFTLADAGKEFLYTIHETTLPAEGWTNAPDVTVTIAVGDDNDGDGKLPVTVEYSAATADGSAALFNNSYQPATPDQPMTPDQPDQPATPEQPSQPSTPDQPDVPDNQPDQPATPTAPDQPVNPDQPAVPAVPDRPSIAKTADETPVEGMALMGAAGTMLAVTGLCLGLRSRKRDGRR